MDARAAIKLGIDMADFVSLGYLQDLSDAEFMLRAAPAINHINWQVGHLIASEHGMMTQIMPGSMPALPAGFAEKYTSETAKNDDSAAFCKKDELLRVQKEQRAGTLAALAKTTDEAFSNETGVHYAKTVADMFTLQGCHWLMHCGQWAVVRRQLGRPPLF